MFREQQISIRMISEGSCDTKDWSNDAENSGLHFKMLCSRKQCFDCYFTFTI